MTLCKDCEFWHAPTEDYEEGWGNCELSKSDGGEAKHSSSKAVAQDFEGCMASLETRPDFGCVMGVPKAKES